MGFWNYRVILTAAACPVAMHREAVLRKDGHRPGSGTPQYAIHEVFYNDQGEAWTCTEDPVSAAGDTLTELAEDLEHYAQALERPVLVYEDFPNEEAMPAALARDASGELSTLEDLRTELEAAGGGETGEPVT